MSHYPTVAKRTSHLFLGSVCVLLVGSLILFPGCDTGDKAQTVAQKDIKAPTQTDGHDHDHMDKAPSDET